MNRIIFYITLVIMAFCAQNLTAQTFDYQAEIKSLTEYKNGIEEAEKKGLQDDILKIEKRLNKNEITKEEAQKLKEEAAQKRALNIEDKISIADSQIALLDRNKNYESLEIYNKYGYESNIRIGRIFEFNSNGHRKKDTVGTKERLNRRTYSYLVFAIGANNLVTDGAVAHSNFKYAGSRFYEWGIAFNRKLGKNSNLLHLQYGLSLMYNDLKATDNRLFVDNGKETTLETNAVHMKDSRFRNVNLVVPVHFELDFSKTRHEGFRLGMGGYAGVNLKTKQIVKYDVEGYKTRDVTKGNFNVNDFVYGLSTYVGYKSTSLYLKYDLNPLFKDNVIDQNNISLGLRFDL